MTIAHPARVYVVVDEQPVVKREALADLIELQKRRLRDFLTEPVDPAGDLVPSGSAKAADRHRIDGVG